MTREEILLIAKPILFNTDMVRAVLDGRESATRRVVKPQPDSDMKYKLGYCVDGDKRDIGKFGFGSHEYGGHVKYAKPPYQIGDYLYVRETWSVGQVYGDNGTYGFDCFYAADDKILPVITNDFKKYCGWGKFFDKNGWNPSIHMPKQAARIFLRVTDVRVERLQDITEEQARKEGAINNIGFIHSPENEYDSIHTAKEHFMTIWNSTVQKKDIDKYSWNANPWVWVTEFERVEVQ